MYYEKHFAGRLLNSRVASREMEFKIISNFKRDFGSTFTKKLEHMFGDIDAQEELNS